MSVLLDCAAVSTNPSAFSVEDVLKERVLLLVLRTVYKTPELEYLHYALQIVNHALKVHALRRTICSKDLRMANEISDSSDASATYYHTFLRQSVEKQAEVISIDKLHKKVVRQRKEIEQWASAVKKAQEKSTA